VRAELADTRVFNLDPGKIKRLKIVIGKQTLDAARKADLPKEWAVQNELPGFVADSNRLEVLAAELAKLSAERFLAIKEGGKPEHGLSDAERSLFIEIHLEADKDKKEEAKPLTLTVGKLLEPQGGYAAAASTLPGDVLLLHRMPWDLFLKDGIDFFNKDAKKKEEPKEDKKDGEKKEPSKDEKKEPEKKPEPAPEPKKE
jgi:hypothetical protein